MGLIFENEDWKMLELAARTAGELCRTVERISTLSVGMTASGRTLLQNALRANELGTLDFPTILEYFEAS